MSNSCDKRIIKLRKIRNSMSTVAINKKQYEMNRVSLKRRPYKRIENKFLQSQLRERSYND